MSFDQLVDLCHRTHVELFARAIRVVDAHLVVRNWLFGQYIVEFEQNGADRATYGANLIESLAQRLSPLKIRGTSATRLKLYRSFYRYFSIGPTLSDELKKLLPPSLEKSPTASDLSQQEPLLKPSTLPIGLLNHFTLGWSHYVELLTIDVSEERRFYEIEAAANQWSVRELQRQIASSLYQRLALSRDKDEIRRLASEGQVVEKAADLVKNPLVLEFLGLADHPSHSETDLESAIIDQLESFLLELGKGFLFEARQKRFTFDNDHFRVDLVFYNRLLRCYVLIDLKRDKLTHQDLGQMQMYVNYFDRHVKLPDESPTVGILLCHRKNDALVELTLPPDTNIFASKYQLYLPTKEEFKARLESITTSLDDSRHADN
jgi:predicted nuclease of restriction endonuclease-like (RecB) superfamily